MIKILKISILALILSTNALAGSDGELEISKDPKNVKDCFEPLNRATFAFNKGFDSAILKPIAKTYRSLPPTIKKGTGNVLNNLSNLITIPNNILQGEFKKAGINTGRLIVNTNFVIFVIVESAVIFGLTIYL